MLQFLFTVALFLVTVIANENIPYRLFTSKTTYHTVSAKEIKKPDDYSRPHQIFMFTRHGATTPNSALLNTFIPKLMEYKNKFIKDAKLCTEDVQAIKNWIPIVDNTSENSLTQKGLDEIKELALRVRQAFPELFNRSYDSNSYKVLTTSEKQCVLTGQTFIQNVLNDNTIPEIPICDIKDNSLKIEDLKQVDPNYDEVMDICENEIKEFITGKHMTGVLQRVADKMGIESTDLDYDIITAMYEVCAYEWSISESAIPPWCRVFCQKDLEILEYADELFWHFFVGYGNQFNAKLSCPMAIRLEDSFKKKINGEGPDSVFYFVNSANILSLFVMLGIGKGDIALTGSNYTGMEQLEWRTSRFNPWAANFMAVLYEDGQKANRVAFYSNENLIPITLTNGESCTGCLWSDIEEKLKAYITENDCANFVATHVVQNYSETDLYWYFSAKTNYELVAAQEIYVPRNLKPIQIFTVNRHGKTASTSKFFSHKLPKINDLKEKLTENAKMTKSDSEAIINWKQSPEFNIDDKVLIQKGRDEIKALALRVKNAFPSLFEQSNDYEALTMEVHRCKETGKIFLQTVYGDQSIIDVPVCKKDDFFLMVEEIKKKLTKGQREVSEHKKFKKSKFITNVVERVKVKMGSDNVTFDDVSVMYEACRYERSFRSESISPWCSVFCREDLEILEYYDDLFWCSFAGYERPINVRLACPMAQRLLETIEAKINGNGPRCLFQFAHRTNIMSLRVMLGWGKDDHQLTSENFDQMKNRRWRTSQAIPWSANFMAVLFENPDGGHDVAFYFNEHITPLKIENDPPCTVCSWPRVKILLETYINDNDCVDLMARLKLSTDSDETA